MTWEHNDTVIDVAQSRYEQSSNFTVLDIIHLVLEDAGTYSCIVEFDSSPPLQSAVAKLTLIRK